MIKSIKKRNSPIRVYSIIKSWETLKKRLNESLCVQVDNKHYIRAQGCWWLCLTGFELGCVVNPCSCGLGRSGSRSVRLELLNPSRFPGPLCGELPTQGEVSLPDISRVGVLVWKVARCADCSMGLQQPVSGEVHAAPCPRVEERKSCHR